MLGVVQTTKKRKHPMRNLRSVTCIQAFLSTALIQPIFVTLMCERDPSAMTKSYTQQWF